MNEAVEVPAWASMITAFLLFAGAAITLIGTLGLLRLRTFYEGSTLLRSGRHSARAAS